MSSLGKLLDFLHRLDTEKIQYRLDCDRDAVMVVLVAPNKYYEVEFFEDGRVELQTWGPASEVEVVPYEDLGRRVISEIL
jgi:hypothetical protein